MIKHFAFSIKKHLAIASGIMLFMVPTTMFATTHIVNFGGSLGLVFSPSSFSAHVGDTVTWNGDFTMHSTTSVTIPAGAAAWNHGVGGTGAGTTFSYLITVAGAYNYQCTPHASLGMVGSFTVTSSAVRPTSAPLNNTNDISVQTLSLSGNISLLMNLPRSEIVSLNIVDIAGRQVMSTGKQRFEAGVNRLQLKGVSNGFYTIRVIADNKAMTNTFAILK